VRDWLWSPRPLSISWRPAYAFAFAITVLVGSVASLTRSPQAIPGKQVFVQFRLDAPQASRVALAGNFTNWQPTLQLTRAGGGTWTVVVPLKEGVHKYSFVIDGKVWQTDPLAPSVSDGFGGENSQIAILSPDAVIES
jgi:1,4-alpha-glucan branching enzyme